MTTMLHPQDFFDLSDEAVSILFAECEYVWQALTGIGQHITRLLGGGHTILGKVEPGAYLSNRPIYIGEGAIIEGGAYVMGPAYIGAGVVVRHGAYVRENVILLPGSVLGHASEAKNSIFLPGSHAPHFNYVGDSVLGYRVNLGAGTKLSNLAIVSEKDPFSGKRPTIKISIDSIEYDTGLRKLGAVLGDDAQTGCNSVLNPGCLVGPRALIYPNLSVRKGYYPPDIIIKLRQEVLRVPRI
jgi:NDP-sugar pyrophosphorylase family protein